MNISNNEELNYIVDISMLALIERHLDIINQLEKYYNQLKHDYTNEMKSCGNNWLTNDLHNKMEQTTCNIKYRKDLINDIVTTLCSISIIEDSNIKDEMFSSLLNKMGELSSLE